MLLDTHHNFKLEAQTPKTRLHLEGSIRILSASQQLSNERKRTNHWLTSRTPTPQPVRKLWRTHKLVKTLAHVSAFVHTTPTKLEGCASKANATAGALAPIQPKALAHLLTSKASAEATSFTTPPLIGSNTLAEASLQRLKQFMSTINKRASSAVLTRVANK